VKIDFLPVDLTRWDQAPPGDLLAVGLYSDVRPLRGAAGLLDWRFDGRLSALIVAGNLSGALDEQLLMPTRQRLPWRLALAVGLGPVAAMDEARFTRVVNRTLATMRGLSLSRLAMALPGRDAERIPARLGLQLFLKEAEETLPGIVAELTLIESVSGQKELGEVVRRRGSVPRSRDARARGAV
jgi:Cytosol aminopeptidase family, N-terminal domain